MFSVQVKSVHKKLLKLKLINQLILKLNYFELYVLILSSLNRSIIFCFILLCLAFRKDQSYLPFLVSFKNKFSGEGLKFDMPERITFVLKSLRYVYGFLSWFQIRTNKILGLSSPIFVGIFLLLVCPSLFVRTILISKFILQKRKNEKSIFSNVFLS